MTAWLKRSGVLLGGLLLLCAPPLMSLSCELESGECTDVADIQVNFQITATLLRADGEPAAGAAGYIRTYKEVCDGTVKSVAPLHSTASGQGTLVVVHGYNLRSQEDRVTIEVGFDDGTDHTPALRHYSYDQLKDKDGQTLNVALEVFAQ